MSAPPRVDHRDDLVVGQDGKSRRFGWARFTIDGVSVVAPTINGRIAQSVQDDDPRPR